MKIYLIFLMLFVCPEKLSATNNQILDRYIKKRAIFLHDKINENLQAIRQSEANFTAEPIILGPQTTTIGFIKNVEIFSLFKKTFFIINDQIFAQTSGERFKWDLYGNFTANTANVIFFKSFEFHNMGFILTGTENETLLYSFTVTSTSPKLIQTISSPGNSDAIFFVNKDHLYIACATNYGNILDMGHITFYQWLGSHFDEVESIYTTGPTCIGSFSFKKSEIIIVGQSLPGKNKIFSAVFEFKNNEVKKLQHLNTNKPTHMNIFFQNSYPYVLIYEESKRQRYFKWNGFEMVLLKMFHWEHKVDKSIVVYSKATPLIVQPQLNGILAYLPQEEDIVLHTTKGHPTNYSVILDINIGENENGNITFIAGLNENNIINIYSMSFGVLAEMEKQQHVGLSKCFNNLQVKVYDQRKRLDQMKYALSQTQNAAEKDTSNFRKRQATTNDFIDVTDIENRLEDIKTRLDKAKLVLMNHEDSNINDVVVNGRTVIKGNLVTQSATAINLNIKEINGKKWIPKRWLRYKEIQTIVGPTKIPELRTKILNLEEDKIFKNILMNQGIQTLTGNFKIENITATEIFTNKINHIDADNIYKVSDPILIKGLKTFNNVFAKIAQVDRINNEDMGNIIYQHLKNNSSESKPKFAPEVHIENLEVDLIDTINWSEFENSVFKIGEDDTIEGNLITSEIVSTYLTTKYLNGINTNYLMTKSTDQEINSTIEFNNIEAFSIECGTINGINITRSAAIDRDGTIIKGPVRIENVQVKGDLEMVGNKSQSLFVNRTDRVWGTNESDLIQRYVEKVVIKGNLYVKGLLILPNATIFINDNKYTLDVLNDYWTKTTNQTIPVHFEATKGLSTPHLRTRFLNTIPMNDFALNDKTSRLMGPIFFENVTVNGNIFLDNNGHNNNSLDLKKLAREGVKNDGEKYQIKGKKMFKDIKAKSLQADILNGKEIGGKPINPDTGNYKKLTIKGDLTSNIIYADTINDIDISKFRRNILDVNSPQNWTNVEFRNITAEALYVSTINGHSVMEYLEKLGKILTDKRIETVTMKGDSTIQTVQDVKSINSIDMTEFLGKKELIQEIQDESDPDLIGDVKFIGNVKVGNLRARNINGINFPDLTRRLFYKKSNQSVSGMFTFKNLKTVHLYAEKINNQNVKNLIDISSTDSQGIIAPNSIVFKNVRFEKSMNATKMLPCDLNMAMTHMRYPKSQQWARVEISGNIKVIDENCILNRIMDKSVKRDEENVILAPVIVHGHFLTNRVRLSGKLNGINLTELIEDAVLSNSEQEQLINGHKTFSNIDADAVTVLDNADIPIVNKIYIPELLRRIITKDIVNNVTILGKKTFFGGLQSEEFFSEKISGIQPENIVNLANHTRIPNALFDSLEIRTDLNIKFINSYELDFMLNNRLLTNTSQRQFTNAVYYFSELEVQDNLRTPSINNIELKNVIFDLDKQKISAPKRFLQDIIIKGNVDIGYLNGINISQAYENALVRGREEVINGSITILQPVKFEGNITAQTINGYPIEKIKTIMNASSAKDGEGFIFNTTRKIKNIIMETLPAVQHMPNELMYIERSEDLQIKIQNAVDARVTVIKDYFLIHVLSEESHIKCNLPEGCKCPVQHTVEITPHLSVGYFLNKGQQRIYSYDDDTMTIHLITSSISTNTYCRTNQSKVFNEMSTISWSTTTTGNTTGSFNVYPSLFVGYISGVEFFTLNDITYAIIARYYDPVADTHDLDCTIIKFSDDKATAIEIQKIRTQGVWTLYLLHTAQGVTLVIGNMAKQPYTEIYRFHEDIGKFELLRSIAFGCTKAVGVVLGIDSLIILADNSEPLQVLKYDSYFDNYYYYQMFALDEHVVGISVFYVGGFGISDAYLCIVTEGNYRIYSFQYIDGWKLESTGTMKGLRNLIPVQLNNKLYLFAPSSDESSLLTIVKHGAGET